MIIMLPCVAVILLKYWKRIILAQKELSLRGFKPTEPMKISDYFSMLFSLKGWLKIAEKRGRDQTLGIYFLFNVLMMSIIFIGGSYAFPNIIKLPRFLFSIVIGTIVSVYFFRTYLKNNRSIETPFRENEAYSGKSS